VAARLRIKTYYGGLITGSDNMEIGSGGLDLNLQITKYKLQTNHNPKITNYKKKGVLWTNFKRLRRDVPGSHFYAL
jgi:hypothetical protein